jgi:hypothetical protein
MQRNLGLAERYQLGRRAMNGEQAVELSEYKQVRGVASRSVPRGDGAVKGSAGSAG